jgi:hypothetical protein
LTAVDWRAWAGYAPALHVLNTTNKAKRKNKNKRKAKQELPTSKPPSPRPSPPGIPAPATDKLDPTVWVACATRG